jgi:hypothetical protein
VTSESLCDLTREYSSKPGVAEALCEMLAEGALRAYRNLVEAQTGKAFTEAEAEGLRSLSREV